MFFLNMFFQREVCLKEKKEILVCILWVWRLYMSNFFFFERVIWVTLSISILWLNSDFIEYVFKVYFVIFYV